jgi:hypothetical protein
MIYSKYFTCFLSCCCSRSVILIGGLDRAMFGPVAKRFARSPSIEPPAKVEPPKKKVKIDMVLAQTIMERRGVWAEDTLDCLCMMVLDHANPSTSKQKDAYELLPGRYYKIENNYNGYPVFRQEACSDADAPNNRELFIYYSPIQGRTGWFISENISCLHDERSIVAWGAELEHSTLPPVEGWHIPVWGKDGPVDDVICTPLVTFLSHELEESRKELAHLELEAYHGAVGADAKGIDKGNSDGADSKGIDAIPSKDEGDKSKGKGDKSKGKGKKQGPSGWMERVAPLLILLADENVGSAKALALELSERHDMAACLERLKKRQAWNSTSSKWK